MTPLTYTITPLPKKTSSQFLVYDFFLYRIGCFIFQIPASPQRCLNGPFICFDCMSKPIDLTATFWQKNGIYYYYNKRKQLTLFRRARNKKHFLGQMFLLRDRQIWLLQFIYFLQCFSNNNYDKNRYNLMSMKIRATGLHVD